MAEALPGGGEYSLDEFSNFRSIAAIPGLDTGRKILRTAVVLLMLSENPTVADHARLLRVSKALGVTEPAIEVIGAIASGEVSLEMVRTAEFDVYQTPVPRELALLPAYSRYLAMGLPAAAIHGTVGDPRLAELFESLKSLPEGTTGHAFTKFYAEHEWRMPGAPGGVALPLTLHDWIHVYIGSGTAPLGEVEVGAFAAGCTRHPRGFFNLLIVLLMFEYGMVSAMEGGPGLAPDGVRAGRRLNRDRGRGVSGHPDGGRAVADAVLRGWSTTTDLYLGVDHVAHAEESLANFRIRHGVSARGSFAAGLKPER
jgi:hypothetical protein